MSTNGTVTTHTSSAIGGVAKTSGSTLRQNVGGTIDSDELGFMALFASLIASPEQNLSPMADPFGKSSPEDSLQAEEPLPDQMGLGNPAYNWPNLPVVAPSVDPSIQLVSTESNTLAAQLPTELSSSQLLGGAITSALGPSETLLARRNLDNSDALFSELPGSDPFAGQVANPTIRTDNALTTIDLNTQQSLLPPGLLNGLSPLGPTINNEAPSTVLDKLDGTTVAATLATPGYAREDIFTKVNSEASVLGTASGVASTGAQSPEASHGSFTFNNYLTNLIDQQVAAHLKERGSKNEITSAFQGLDKNQAIDQGTTTNTSVSLGHNRPTVADLQSTTSLSIPKDEKGSLLEGISTSTSNEPGEVEAPSLSSTPAPHFLKPNELGFAVASTEASTSSMKARIDTAVGQQGWADNLSKLVVSQIGNKLQSAEIAVNPPQLGPILVQVDFGKDQQLSVHFAAVQSATREAIQAALPRLDQVLSTSGIDLGQVSVGSEHRQGQPSDHNQPSSPFYESERKASTFVSDDKSASPIITRTSKNALSLVDFYA